MRPLRRALHFYAMLRRIHHTKFAVQLQRDTMRRQSISRRRPRLSAGLLPGGHRQPRASGTVTLQRCPLGATSAHRPALSSCSPRRYTAPSSMLRLAGVLATPGSLRSPPFPLGCWQTGSQDLRYAIFILLLNRAGGSRTCQRPELRTVHAQPHGRAMHMHMH